MSFIVLPQLLRLCPDIRSRPGEAYQRISKANNDVSYLVGTLPLRNGLYLGMLTKYRLKSQSLHIVKVRKYDKGRGRKKQTKFV